MKKICLMWIVAALATAFAHGQSYLKQQEFAQRLNNGVQLFYTQVPGTSQYEIMLAYQFGSMAEDTTTDGLAYVCHTVFLNALQQQLKLVESTLKVDGRMGHEVSTYRFTIPVAKLNKALDAIVKLYATEPDSTAITNAIIQNATLVGVVQNTLMYPAELTLLNRHWGLRSAAMSIYGKQPMPDSITVEAIKTLYHNGYCMESALFNFTGPNNFREVWSKVQEYLGPINTCRGIFNTKLANLFPQPKLSSKVVYNVGSATPTRYQKLYHGPYISYDAKGTVTALVLKALLMQSATLDALCDSMGIAQLRMAYDPMRFTSGLTWHIFPTQDSLHIAYSNFDTLMALMASQPVFPASEIEAAKTALLKQFEAIIKNPSQKMYLVSQYWVQGILPWLNDYPAILKSVDHRDINKLISTYVTNHKHTDLLLLNDADSANYRFTEFTTTYTEITSIPLYFQKNTANFASPADDSTLTALIQTLLLNKDYIVSLNGQAYKSELLDVKDDSLAAELDKYEGYYIYPKNLLSKKSYRLDIYRTAKTIGLLLKAGIKATQLKGTGALYKGQEKEEYKLTVSPGY